MKKPNRYGLTARKRCRLCGVVGWYKPRERRCRQLRGLLGSYWCWGDLELATQIRASEGGRKRPQDVAQRKLEHARRMVDEKMKAVARVARALRLCEARARRYARLASMTDDEVAAERARRSEQMKVRPARRRGIAITAESGAREAAS